MDLLKKLCAIHAPSGDEAAIKDFILAYVKENEARWKVKPQLIAGEELMDCVLLVFGQPKTAVFAHVDSIGYTVSYQRKLLNIGSPRAETGWILEGEDEQGKITCELIASGDGKSLTYEFEREIAIGTNLTFKPFFMEGDEFVQSAYLDNRLGVWNALKLAETLENGILCFTTYEEVGGGATAHVAKYIYENYQVRQALISDITWVTRGVKHGKGVAISLRDSGMPRRSYVNRIIALAKQSQVRYQLEVEEAGGSDGNVIHRSPYPIDWCFVGAPEANVHTPDERVHKADIEAMQALYRYLMQHL